MRQLYIFFFAFFLSCKTTKSSYDSWVALYRNRIWDDRKGFVLPEYERDTRSLCYDSLIIVERQRLNIHRHNGKQTSWNVDVIGYTFIDLRTKSFYEYDTFSDTATIKDSYIQPASGRVKGGWNFFDAPKKAVKINIALPDTVLNGVLVERIKNIYYTDLSETEASGERIIYLACKSPAPFFFLEKIEGEKSKCPIIRRDILSCVPSSNCSKTIKGFEEIEVFKSTLSFAEMKVFKAWKKNSLLYPAKIPKNN